MERERVLRKLIECERGRDIETKRERNTNNNMELRYDGEKGGL